ncbi:MAG: hypothetical protein GDA50_04240 [Alphaproteobacteria bacterium GM202ARS2]|nr:hypothetical protein [Alphaproteobacteria bacterium GM202ARS2]
MTTLQEFRTKYPQYDDVSDNDLAGMLHQKFYSDMPRDQFDARLGGAALMVPQGMHGQFSEGARAAIPADVAAGEGRPSITGTKVEEDIRKDFVEPFAEWVTSPGGDLADRAGGILGFAGSLPVRIATQGQYGLGDVLPGTLGQSAAEAEQAFVERNRPGLQVAQNIGEGLGFVPTARSMGYVPPAPRVRGAVQPHERAQMSPENPQARATDARTDAATYAEQAGLPTHPGIELGPSGRQIAKVLEQQPVIGAPLRAGTREILDETRKRTEQIAGEFGPSENFPSVGNIARNALERFRREQPEIDVERLDDRSVKSLADEPPSLSSLPVVAEARYEWAWRGIPKTMREGRSKKDLPRVLGGVPAATEEVHRQIGRNTGIINREEAIRVRSLKYDPRSGEYADPTLPSPANLSLVRGGGGAFPGMAIPRVGNPLLNQALDNISRGVWRGTAQDIRNLRTEVRRQIAGLADNEKNVASLADLNRLHHALGQDFYHLLKRNAKEYRRGGQPKIASQFDEALAKFKDADEFYRKAQEDIARLRPFAYEGATGERVGNQIYRAALAGGKGNIELLKSLKRTVRPEEWNAVGNAMIRELGSVPPGQPGLVGEIGFSLTRFATSWASLNPQAKQLLFRGKRAAFKELNAMANLARQFRDFEALANTSRTGIHNLTVAILGGGAIAAYNYPFTTLSAAALGYGGTTLLTNTRFLRWLNKGRQLEKPAYRGNVKAQRALANHLAGLQNLIAQDVGIANGFRAIAQQTAPQGEMEQ